MEILLVLIVLVALLGLLDWAALHWGYNTRPTYNESRYPDYRHDW